VIDARSHYVYLHRKASDNAVFYVGKGKGRRAWSSSSRNKHWQATAAKNGFVVQIVKDALSEPCALTLERIVIARFGMGNSDRPVRPVPQLRLGTYQ
jgi:hypothetical protein